MDSLAKYTLEMIEIIEEVRVKMQRVKVIKAELEILKLLLLLKNLKYLIIIKLLVIVDVLLINHHGIAISNKEYRY